MQVNLSFLQEIAVLTALQSALRFYDQNMIQSSDAAHRAFWLPFIRETYNVYRFLGGKTRYHKIVKPF